MFDEIIDSKKLSQAAAVFLILPPRSYSVGEAASVLRVPSGAAAYTLNKLAENGILRSFFKHGKKFFFLSDRASIPPWAKNKILKFKRKTEDKLCKELKKLSAKGVFLSGVFTGYNRLPVDLLLVGRVNLNKLDKLLNKWQGIMGLDLNYSLISEKEFIARRDTFDRFIKDVFDHRFIIVIDRTGRKK